MTDEPVVSVASVDPVAPVDKFYPTKAEGISPSPDDKAIVDPPAEEPKVEEPKAEEPKAELKVEPKAEELSIESYNITLPEGLIVDEPLMKEFKELSLKNKLAPETAQEMVGFYKKAMEGQINKLEELIPESLRPATRAAWAKEISAMPEFQGEREATSSAVLGRVMDEFGSPELKLALNSSGFGDNPHLVKMILEMATALVEGGPTETGSPAPTGKDGKPTKGRSYAESFYPNQAQGN